jgi:membrane-bound serine protease (ClpP class)
LKRKALLFFTIIVSVLSFFSFTSQSQGASKKVYVIPLENEVGKGMYKFLNRGLHEAEKAEADLIVIKMDTPGGAVDSAIDIGKRFSNEKIPIVTFVDNEALSAGAYIALNTDEIYMTKSAVMGAAAPITMDGNTAGKKAQSRWNAAMESAANSYGVDSKYALAMADESVNVPEYGAGEDKLLTLTAKNALEVGYSKGTEENLDSLLQKLGYSDASITTVDESVSEKIARFVTNPIVVPILLSIGSLTLIIELFTPTFGLSGFVGILSLLLFFFGHMIAGFAGIETIVLFIIGLVLLFWFRRNIYKFFYGYNKLHAYGYFNCDCCYCSNWGGIYINEVL